MTRLSVNLNKVALIRNARGSDYPNLLQVALDCEAYGAQGITVHPRPDQRHIRYDDIPELQKRVTTEFNIEGNPTEQFMNLVLSSPPDQCTLVPDLPGALTSDSGWDTIKYQKKLKSIIRNLHQAGIRVSMFMDPDIELIKAAADTGTDRIEFYTGPYAARFSQDPEEAIAPYHTCALLAHELGLGVNAGHDLNLDNLKYFKQRMPYLLEVSIGHALISDALYFGLQNTIQMYKNLLT